MNKKLSISLGVLGVLIVAAIASQGNFSGLRSDSISSQWNTADTSVETLATTLKTKQSELAALIQEKSDLEQEKLPDIKSQIGIYDQFINNNRNIQEKLDLYFCTKNMMYKWYRYTSLYALDIRLAELKALKNPTVKQKLEITAIESPESQTQCIRPARTMVKSIEKNIKQNVSYPKLIAEKTKIETRLGKLNNVDIPNKTKEVQIAQDIYNAKIQS